MIYGNYTDSNALISILSSGKLWATNIKFLNDEQEFVHALGLVKEILNNSRKKTKVNHGNLHQYRSFIDQVMNSLDDLDELHSEDIFTCSFSEEKDLLSQWRGYCRGVHGYCIHFDLDMLLAAVSEKFLMSEIHSCVYDDEKKRKKILGDLNLHWKNYAKLKSADDKEKEIFELKYKISTHASHFKHSSFSEEKEHRLVIRESWVVDAPIKFRTGPMSIIPYLEIPAPKEAVKGIGVGPTRDQELANRGVDALRKTMFDVVGLLDCEVVPSLIPYRS